MDDCGIFEGLDGHHVAFRRAKLSPELLAWMLEEEVLSAEPQRLLQLGFDACVDYPQLPDHHYYEGYFHARGGGRPGDSGFDASLPAKGSLHPRTGRCFDKPAAPPRLRAFIEAFRRVNQPWLDTVLEAMDHSEPADLFPQLTKAACARVDAGARHDAHTSFQRSSRGA